MKYLNEKYPEINVFGVTFGVLIKVLLWILAAIASLVVASIFNSIFNNPEEHYEGYSITTNITPHTAQVLTGTSELTEPMGDAANVSTHAVTIPVTISESIIVVQGNTYYNEESRFTFSPVTIFSTFADINTTVYGQRTRRQNMRSGQVLEYTFDERTFRFTLDTINWSDNYVIITIREYIQALD